MVKTAPPKSSWESDLQQLRSELKHELAKEVETQVSTLSVSSAGHKERAPATAF